MASKVNVRFVVMLSGALGAVLVCMAAVFYFVLRKSGEDWAVRGDEAMAAQDYEAADQAYSFAVAHERTNVEWLEKWLDAMQHHVIDNQIDFMSRYNRDYTAVMRMVAHAAGPDPDRHLRYLNMMLERVYEGGGAESWRYLITEARASLEFFEDSLQPAQAGVTAPEGWHRLYRFSGIAMGNLYGMGLHETEEAARRCENEMRLALAADPGDTTTALELSQYYAVRSDRLRTQAPIDLAGAETSAQQARQVLVDVIGVNPDDLSGALGLLQLDVNRALRELRTRTGAGQPTMAQLIQTMEPFVARLDAIGERLGAQAGAVDRMTLLRFALAEAVIAPVDNRRRTEAIARGAAESGQGRPAIMVLLGETLAARGQYQEAVGVLQRVVDLPNKPLGIEGWRLFLLRPMSMRLQAEYTLRRYDDSLAEEERQAILREGRAFRDALAAEVAADSPDLLKIDAQTAFVQHDFVNAENLLIRLNERTGGSDQDVMWWLAQTAAALNKPGVARELLYSLNQSQPNNPRIIRALAGIELALRNEERARAFARQLLELDPDNPETQTFAASVLGQGQNPIINALEAYYRTAQGEAGSLGDPDLAIANLQAAFEANEHDQALGGQLIRVYIDRRELDKALAVVETLQQENPDEEAYPRFASALRRGEYVATLIELINTGPADEFTRAMARRVVYMEANMPEEARRALAEAAAIRPDDRDVLEAQFLEAAAANNGPGVQRVVDRARTLDVDGRQGDTFVARQRIFEGRHGEAVALLERLRAATPNDTVVLRLLGLEYIALERFDEAINSYRRALGIRPQELQSSRELIALLVQLERFQEALSVARTAEPFGRGDPSFINSLWFLEARAGDKQVALRGREGWRGREPANESNNYQLAEIYMDLGRWDDARALVDEMRSRGDRLEFVGLDARWHADRGDLAAAQQAYVDYIGRLPAAELTPAPFIALAQFMLSREQYELAAAALESGRVTQSPETMDIDRMLGDVFVTAQRLSDAADAYGRVVEANADTPEGLFRKRLLENLIRLERLDEAQAQLDALRAAGLDGDRNTLLLRAELAGAQGQAAQAEDLLDEAVRRFPEDPVVYFQRAELLQADPARLQDALADYDTAIRKQPRFWQALRNRSGVYRRLDRINDAVADLRAATTAAGSDGESVTQLLIELLNLGRAQEASTAADEAVAARPTDVLFIQRVAAVFATRGEWATAARFYKSAFELRPEAAVAQRYLDSLLSQNPPQVRVAEDVLTGLGQVVLEHPGLLAANVTISVRRNRMTQAEADATRAFDLVSQDPNRLLVWYRTMERAFATRDAFLAYLRRLAAAKQATILRDWPVLFINMVLTDDPQTLTLAIEQLNNLANNGRPDAVRLNAMRTIGTTLYEHGDHAQAAHIWEQALLVFPNDYEVSNNLAYTLVEHLGRPEEGLQHALRAVQGVPRSASVNDTVGWAYYRTGDVERAQAYLLKAARLSRDAGEQATIVVHIIEVEIHLGNRVAAERYLTYLRRVIDESPWIGENIKTVADGLEERINSLPS
ncbi:MAG: tetratricopeptide repeat protein [Phycisphaeraceae bacterium]|nr:tetratricopeptide repeat protein [Phycisphaeraceae bacterium]